MWNSCGPTPSLSTRGHAPAGRPPPQRADPGWGKTWQASTWKVPAPHAANDAIRERRNTVHAWVCPTSRVKWWGGGWELPPITMI